MRGTAPWWQGRRSPAGQRRARLATRPPPEDTEVLKRTAAASCVAERGARGHVLPWIERRSSMGPSWPASRCLGPFGRREPSPVREKERPVSVAARRPTAPASSPAPAARALTPTTPCGTPPPRREPSGSPARTRTRIPGLGSGAHVSACSAARWRPRRSPTGHEPPSVSGCLTGTHGMSRRRGAGV